MPVVDSHIHLLTEKWRPEEFLQGLAKIGSAISGLPSETIRNDIFPAVWDEDGRKRLGIMADAGIDISIVHPIDFGLADQCGDTLDPIYAQNKALWAIARNSDGQLFASAGSDPRRDNALAILEEGVEAGGAVALKLHPGTGFYPNDRICYPLYEKAGELNVPVIIHTGPIAAPLKSKYCLPVYVDEVASDFPDLKIAMAHAGYRWWPEALNMAEVNPNLYLDLSGWQEQSRAPQYLYSTLRSILDGIGSKRVMWGTDGPMYSQILADGEWLEAIRDANNRASSFGISFSKTEISDLLSATALSFYGIEQRNAAD